FVSPLRQGSSRCHGHRIWPHRRLDRRCHHWLGPVARDECPGNLQYRCQRFALTALGQSVWRTELGAPKSRRQAPLPDREKTMHFLFPRFNKDQAGVTAIEYGLIAALVAVVIIGAVSALGTSVQSTFNTVALALP